HTPSGHYSVKSGYHVTKASTYTTQPSPSSSDTLRSCVCLNTIPTAQILYNRKCLHSPICSRCHIHSESVQHALFDCKDMKKTNFSPESFNLYTCMLWKCWSSINAFIFRNQFGNPNRIQQEAEEYLDFYHHEKEMKWSPPAIGCLKLNVDGAVSGKMRKTGMGAF
ncbi:hypothetical protein G4B88_014388, partial [Cannabis sativa]